MIEAAGFALLVFEHGSLVGRLVEIWPDLGRCLDAGAALVLADPDLGAWSCPGVAAG
ncbi:MAG: hypothetical protein AAF401_09725 [Pseudomonadota bacterium]